MFEDFKRKQITVGDVEIACVVDGERPPVLMLHGYLQSLAMWVRVAPKLAERYTAVCADLRGYGDSSKPRSLPDNSTYSFRAMADDQFGLMQALVFDGSGGKIAQLFDIPAEGRKRCADVTAASLPGGHFFVDQFPAETAEHLLRFLGNHR